MRYEFPEIRHLDDVRAAIDGRDEFIIAERDWGFVVNYMVNLHDTFPPVVTENDAIRRELRGILFYPDGRIMSRRLQKFFNVNERDETQQHLIDLTQSHMILEKLDGSMITPMVAEGRIRFGTKMGLTDVAQGAEQFAIANCNIMEFCDCMMDRGKTPIFEWCSRQQRIVVDYPNDRLVLLAVRDNITGEYATYGQMQDWAYRYGLDLVNVYPGTADSMEHLVRYTHDIEGSEGWIIRFDDGHMLKIKSAWYVRIHKVKDSLTQEKNVIDLIVNEKIDDAKSFMLDDDRHRIEQFEDAFWTGFNNVASQLYIDLNESRIDMQGDRKRFALELAPKIPAIERSIMFSCWDNDRNVRDELLNAVRKNTGTKTKIDSIRSLWGNVKWSYGFESDS
jgi:RNA ligase